MIRLLLNVTMVTTGHQKSPKMGQNSIKSQSPPQELEVDPHSGPYLLVINIVISGSKEREFVTVHSTLYCAHQSKAPGF